MFLDPRLIALGGLGVPLSPVAVAVQGLIAQIQEEARREEELHGGGGRRRGARAARGSQVHRGHGVTEDEVRAQWELLELRLRASPAPALPVQERPRVALAEPAQAADMAADMAPAGHLQAAEPALLEGLADDEAELLMLLLADMD